MSWGNCTESSIGLEVGPE
jgi:hypothetical protein